MNESHSFSIKNRRKTFQENVAKIDLNISKVKYQGQDKPSLTPRQKRISNVNYNAQKNKNPNNFRMKRISVQPFRQNRLSNYSNYNYQFMNKSIDYESLSPARKNQNFPILTRTKTTDRFWFFTNQANQKINERRKDVNYALNKSKHLSKLENNIKKALNNMIIKIEKNNQNENTISPEKLMNKRTSNPNLKIFYKIKRTKNKNVNNNLQGSFLI